MTYDPAMWTKRLYVDLRPDEHARLSAESRRRGVGPAEVVLDFVRGLPDPENRRRTLEVLAALRESRAQLPLISEEAINDALAESRAELEHRAFAGWEPAPLPATRETPSDRLHSDPP